MSDRPTHGMRSKTRIQCETTVDGRYFFREYWIHEWDGKEHNMNEYITDLDQAIKRALELGNNREAKILEQLKRANN